MLGSILAQLHELLGHILAYHVSTVTQVLECLDPDYTRPRNTLNEYIDPEVFGVVDELEGEG